MRPYALCIINNKHCDKIILNNSFHNLLHRAKNKFVSDLKEKPLLSKQEKQLLIKEFNDAIDEFNEISKQEDHFAMIEKKKEPYDFEIVILGELGYYSLSLNLNNRIANATDNYCLHINKTKS